MFCCHDSVDMFAFTRYFISTPHMEQTDERAQVKLDLELDFDHAYYALGHREAIRTSFVDYINEHSPPQRFVTE